MTDLRKFIKRKVREFLNESFENKLKNKLLSIGGDNVKLGLDTDTEISRMLWDGRVYDEKLQQVKLTPNQCHRNVSSLFRNSNGFKIITGYALSDGIWVQHSWGLQDNMVIETTNINFDIYYGYELSPDESEEFCFSNY